MRDLFEAIAEYMSAEGADARREHAKKVRIEFDLVQERLQELQSRIDELEKDAARIDWMEENYLCADFRYGDPATEVIVIEMPKRSRFCGNLRVDIDTAMQSEKGGV